MLPRRLLLGGSAAVLSAFGSALILSQKRLRVTRHQLAWRGPRAKRIAHVTDVHVGWSTPPRILDDAVEAIHEAKADAVVMTGDYVNHSLHFSSRLRDFVRRLPEPVFATLGNHDHWTDGPAITQLLESSGARVLANEHAVFDDLTIVGIDDPHTGHHDIEAAFSRAPAAADKLVLTHSPTIADHIARQRGARLILAGHTHGGQVRIPHLTRAVADRAGLPYVGGRVELGATTLYVNAGLGHARGGMRYGRAAAAEVAVFDLIPAAHDERTRDEGTHEPLNLGP